jgi:hypothetical protein
VFDSSSKAFKTLLDNLHSTEDESGAHIQLLFLEKT